MLQISCLYREDRRAAICLSTDSAWNTIRRPEAPICLRHLHHSAIRSRTRHDSIIQLVPWKLRCLAFPMVFWHCCKESICQVCTVADSFDVVGRSRPWVSYCAVHDPDLPDYTIQTPRSSPHHFTQSSTSSQTGHTCSSSQATIPSIGLWT